MLDLVYPAWAKRPPGTKQSTDFNTATGLRAFSHAFRVNRRAEHHSVKRGIITKDFRKVAGFGPATDGASTPALACTGRHSQLWSRCDAGLPLLAAFFVAPETGFPACFIY